MTPFCFIPIPLSQYSGKFTISDAFHGYNCRSLGVLPQFYNCDIILTLCNTALCRSGLGREK